MVSAVVLSAMFGRDVWFGMAGPLAVMSGTWVVVERVYTTAPERLTPVMMAAFAGKLVFFGAYVAVVIGVMGAKPVPFVVSFAGYFIALHLIEALWLKRLFAS